MLKLQRETVHRFSPLSSPQHQASTNLQLPTKHTCATPVLNPRSKRVLKENVTLEPISFSLQFEQSGPISLLDLRSFYFHREKIGIRVTCPPFFFFK